MKMASPTSVLKPHNVAVISGGASGIGLAVAEKCLKHYGMRVALIDNMSKNLSLAKQTLESGSSDTVETFEVDVSKETEWAKLKQSIVERFGRVDFLFLNAGISAKGTWGDSDYFKKIMDTNLFGVIHGLNTFVPLLQSQPKEQPSAVVITGSKQGITNPPGNPAYNASKAAVKSIAEHLDFDVRGTNIQAHLLVPGWTFTGLSGNDPAQSNPKPAGAWWPSQVAAFLFEKMEEKRFYIICPDNDVSEDTDKRRMLWSVGDIIHGRPPLTRWRPEYKQEAEDWMQSQQM